MVQSSTRATYLRKTIEIDPSPRQQKGRFLCLEIRVAAYHFQSKTAGQSRTATGQWQLMLCGARVCRWAPFLGGDSGSECVYMGVILFEVTLFGVSLKGSQKENHDFRVPLFWRLRIGPAKERWSMTKSCGTVTQTT